MKTTPTMYKLTLILFCVTSMLYAQEAVVPEFDDVETTEDAELYLKSNRKKGNKLITFNEQNHDTGVAKKLFNSGFATVETQFEITRYKVVKREKNTYYRASYIFIDGNKIDAENAENLIKEITQKYKKGIAFSKLAQQYSMDNNANRNGDTGWFTPGTFNADLEKVIINVPTSQRDLFAFELKEKSWYYLVLNSHEPQEFKEIKVLKIVEKK
ncbi:peptidylprolyl isomerase [Bizionia sp. KMM 8389]